MISDERIKNKRNGYLLTGKIVSMITVICGEDILSSRNYYHTLKGEYRHKGREIKEISPADIPELQKWLGNAPTLFGEPAVFFTEHVNKKITRTSQDLKKNLEVIANNPSTALVIWEEVSARELKFGKLVKVKEFKPQSSIFKLLDLCLPGKKMEFLEAYRSVSTYTDNTFIFLMIVRHVRKLLLATSGVFDKAIPSWQKGKLSSQAKAWNFEKLIAFYESLHKIDVGLKTGSTPYSPRQSLDILVVHFL